MKRIIRRHGGKKNSNNIDGVTTTSAHKNSIILDIIQQFETHNEMENELDDEIMLDYDHTEDNTYERVHEDHWDDFGESGDGDSENDTSDASLLNINVESVLNFLKDEETLKRVYTFRGPILSYKWARLNNTNIKQSTVSRVQIPKDIHESVELFFAILFKFTCDCEEKKIYTGGMMFVNSTKLPGDLKSVQIFNSNHYLVRYILKRNLIIFDKCKSLQVTASW